MTKTKEEIMEELIEVIDGKGYLTAYTKSELTEDILEAFKEY